MSTPLEVLVDGIACTGDWPLDRGLLYGDGLFETMLIRAGRIRFETQHRARLAEGCRRLAIHAGLDAIWRDAAAVAHRHGEAMLRLQVTRGAAVARGYGPTGNERARALLAVFAPPQPHELPPRPRVITLAMRLGENPLLAGLKHCNRLEQVLARRALQETADAFEGLLASSSGVLVSGTMSNVFIELDGELMTPAVDRCGVAGVARSVILQQARELGLPVRIAAIPLARVKDCTGLALSSARLGLLPVHQLDGRDLPGSPRLERLAQRVAGL